MLLVERSETLAVVRKEAHVNKLLEFEAAMKKECDLIDGEDYTKHHHCEGVYLREFFLPEGGACTGEIHRFDCINILLKGKVRVVQSDGEYELAAPMIYESKAGEKKALYALEDTIFCNIHATEETDQTKLREHFTVPSHEFLLENK